MQAQTNIPIKATYLDNNGKTQKKLAKVVDEGLSLDNIKETQLKELQALLKGKGLTIDLILDKYKEAVDMKGIKYRGSDVLKVLERLEELLQLKDNSADQLQIRAMIQKKSASEITTTLIEITGKTQEYINKLTERKET